MKKILFWLVALVATMSMNAQNAKVMKVLDGETVLKTYEVKTTLKVVYEDAPTFGIGKATRTGEVEVKWIQLWENGPKFAEYNVGAENNKAEDYGGYYTWGGCESMDPNAAFKDGSAVLAGDDDTATNLWGSNWRMPTKAEFDDLLTKCDVVWTNDYKGDGSNIKGYIFTGKDDYASNRVFLPAAGYCRNGSTIYGRDSGGYYWSSVPYDSNLSYYLRFISTAKGIFYNTCPRNYGQSVRPVLAEATTTGSADVKDGGTVNWVQLWAGGPKFAEKNVGASSYTDVGTTMSSTEAAKTGEAYVWGANWRTPSQDDMDELQKATSNTGSTKVTCTYTRENGVWGFKFTGIESGYTENSVFFPAQSGSSYSGYADYLAVTVTIFGDTPWDMHLNNSGGTWNSNWYAHPQGNCLVRPVLK